MGLGSKSFLSYCDSFRMWLCGDDSVADVLDWLVLLKPVQVDVVSGMNDLPQWLPQFPSFAKWWKTPNRVFSGFHVLWESHEMTRNEKKLGNFAILLWVFTGLASWKVLFAKLLEFPEL